MNVRELKLRLETLPDDLPVYLTQKDEYTPLQLVCATTILKSPEGETLTTITYDNPDDAPTGRRMSACVLG